MPVCEGQGAFWFGVQGFGLGCWAWCSGLVYSENDSVTGQLQPRDVEGLRLLQCAFRLRSPRHATGMMTIITPTPIIDNRHVHAEHVTNTNNLHFLCHSVLKRYSVASCLGGASPAPVERAFGSQSSEASDFELPTFG